jgi:hypothetical protein
MENGLKETKERNKQMQKQPLNGFKSVCSVQIKQ